MTKPMKKSQPDRPGNSAVSIGKHVRPRALGKAGVKKGAALHAQACRAVPDVTAYLQHEEVRATPSNPRPWQRIWDETAPQARGIHEGTTTNGVHAGAGTD